MFVSDAVHRIQSRDDSCLLDSDEKQLLKSFVIDELFPAKNHGQGGVSCEVFKSFFLGVDEKSDDPPKEGRGRSRLQTLWEQVSAIAGPIKLKHRLSFVVKLMLETCCD